MKEFLRLKKLSQQGIIHHLAPILVTLALGGVTGAFIYVHTVATQPWTGALSVGPPGSKYCLDSPSLTQISTIRINPCKNVLNQKWQLNSASTISVGGKTLRTYQIKSFGAGTQLCVDDWLPGNSMSHLYHPLRLYGCDPTFKLTAEQFYWTGDGHQLKSVKSSLCMDNFLGRQAPFMPVALNQCKTSAPSQDWYEIANTATTGDGSLNEFVPPTAPSPDPGSLPVTPLPTPDPTPTPTPTPSGQNWSGVLQLGSHRSTCLEESDASNPQHHRLVVINDCKNLTLERWTRVPVTSSTFLLKANTGACLDDTNNGVGTTNNRFYAQTVKCTTTDPKQADPAQVWTYAKAGNPSTTDRHEIMNVNSKGCLNDPGSTIKPGQQQIIYSCTSNSANEQWFQAAMPK